MTFSKTNTTLLTSANMQNFQRGYEAINFRCSLPLFHAIESFAETEIWVSRVPTENITQANIQRNLFQLAYLETREDFFPGEVVKVVLFNNFEEIRLDFHNFISRFFDNSNRRENIFFLHTHLQNTTFNNYAKAFQEAPLFAKIAFGLSPQTVRDRLSRNCHELKMRPEKFRRETILDFFTRRPRFEKKNTSVA